MKKTHIYISALALIASVLGATFFSSNIFFAFASTSFSMQIVRLALLGLVLAQVVTDPPRHPMLRTITGGGATVAVVSALGLLFSVSSVGILDIVVMLHAGVALGITALELPARKNLAYKTAKN